VKARFGDGGVAVQSGISRTEKENVDTPIRRVIDVGFVEDNIPRKKRLDAPNGGVIDVGSAMNPSHDDDELLDGAAVEKLTGLPPHQRRRMVLRGELPHIRIGPRQIRFRRGDILAWLDRRRHVPADLAGLVPTTLSTRSR
jgi:predicted DNA-binding transcriptional regulator AlpA